MRVFAGVGCAKYSGSVCCMDTIGRILNHHTVFAGFCGQFCCFLENFRMRFRSFQVGTAYFCDKILIQIKFFKYPANRIHAGGRGQDKFDIIAMVVLDKIEHTWNQVKSGIVIKIIFKVTPFGTDDVFRSLWKIKMLYQRITYFFGRSALAGITIQPISKQPYFGATELCPGTFHRQGTSFNPTKLAKLHHEHPSWH